MNVRHISLLSATLKVTNHIVKKRLMKFLSTRNFFPARSYAYQKHISMNMCLNEIVFTILSEKADGNEIVMHALDIKKSYCCVDLSKLSSLCGSTTG